GRAASERFLHTGHTEEASAADESARVRLPISVWIGQLPSTTNPARMIALTKVSHASGFLLAKTTTIRPSDTRARSQAWNARNMPSSYACLEAFLSPSKRLAS